MQACQFVLVGVEVEDAVGVERNTSQIEGKIGARRGNLLLQRIERFLARVGAKPLKSQCQHALS
jgi:chloramphenicol 3-O-phosphotransferase